MSQQKDALPEINEMQVIREVNIQAEAMYENAVQLGDHAAYALGKTHRAQMTSLESIAESALKTSDILDYVKKQTARFSYWRDGYGTIQEGLGLRLKKYLEEEVAKKRDSICGKNRLNIENKTDEQKQERRRIYLLLMRQFIRQMVVQYEYQASFGAEEKAKNGTHS
ncbi:MAG: hypothetical protein NVSMB38_40130 [Ktedonobacteraceae bacterium]